MLRSQYLLEMHSIIISIIFCIGYLIFSKRQDKATNVLVFTIAVNAMDLFWDIMAYSQQGVVSKEAFQMHMVANFMLMSLECLESGLLIYYFCLILEKYTGKRYRSFLRITCLCEGILMLILIGNFFTGWYFYFDELNYYHRAYMFDVSVVIHGLILIMGIAFTFYHRKELPKLVFWNMLLYFSLPAIGMVLQTLFFGFSYLNVCISICLLGFFICCILEYQKENRKKDQILLQTRICLLGAQMNPHFVFNALSTIGYLMQEDVEIAGEALHHFSSYLRKSIDVDPNIGLVSIQDEWNMAKEYAYIEQLRFDKDFELIIDDGDFDLKVPYLSIEPLVENAIKHGLRNRQGYCYVKVKVRKEMRNFTITVEDNGIGFDPSDLKDNSGRNGIGIKNVEERIQLLCHGSMKVDSRLGEGTLITITIPEYA